MANKKRKSKKRTTQSRATRQRGAQKRTATPAASPQPAAAPKSTAPAQPATSAPAEKMALTAETVDLTPDHGDANLLAESLATLSRAGFTPRREITFPDVVADSSCGMGRFRRHPLVSLLGLRDLNEEQLFKRVHYDLSAAQHTTPAELIDLVRSYARAAGTTDQVGDFNLMLDPGSATCGSFRFTNGDRVNDISFQLDPDFGDEEAEMQVALDVSPEGYRPHTFFAGDTAHPLILWAPAHADLSALETALEKSA